MKEYSKMAWGIAARYSDLLASETRDLAAHIDAAIGIERERCAKVAEAFSDQGRDGHQIAKALRDDGQ